MSFENKSYVYILICKDKSLYTGYTTDLKRRLKEHNTGKGAKYTRARLPVSLAYSLECESKSQAMKIEALIKKFSRQEKQELILKNFNIDYFLEKISNK